MQSSTHYKQSVSMGTYSHTVSCAAIRTPPPLGCLERAEHVVSCLALYVLESWFQQTFVAVTMGLMF